MKKTFETSLPEGYRVAYVFDAKDNKKTVLAMNVANIIVTVAAIALFWVILRPLDGIKDGSADVSGVFENILSRYLIFIVTIVAYLVLHELTHGAAYWLITRQKLKFGFTLSVAYCGVPDIYVYRRTALIALLAPFCVFIPVFLIPMLVCRSGLDRILAGIMLALHLGGCVGDLYDAWLFAVKFRSPDTLMNDTGPRQTFYVKQ